MRRNKKIVLTVLVLVLLIIVIVKCSSKDNNPVEPIPVTGVSGLEIPAYDNSDQIVKHTAYALQYNEDNEQPDWVAYFLTRNRLNGGISRTDNFREDPQVTTGSAQLSDYSHTGYDRGHMAPAGDFTWSQDAMSESFFLSNMSPQLHSFNAGIWETLESQVRTWAGAGEDTLFIAAGPILRSGLLTIGTRKKLTVPEYYFKAILRKSSTGLSAIAFLMKHESSSKPLSAFAITVDSLEKVTNINFFSKLPVSVQNDAESKIDLNKWPGITFSKNQLKKRLSKN